MVVRRVVRRVDPRQRADHAVRLLVPLEPAVERGIYALAAVHRVGDLGDRLDGLVGEQPLESAVAARRDLVSVFRRGDRFAVHLDIHRKHAALAGLLRYVDRRVNGRLHRAERPVQERLLVLRPDVGYAVIYRADGAVYASGVTVVGVIGDALDGVAVVIIGRDLLHQFLAPELLDHAVVPVLELRFLDGRVAVISLLLDPYACGVDFRDGDVLHQAPRRVVLHGHRLVFPAFGPLVKRLGPEGVVAAVGSDLYQRAVGVSDGAEGHGAGPGKGLELRLFQYRPRRGLRRHEDLAVPHFQELVFRARHQPVVLKYGKVVFGVYRGDDHVMVLDVFAADKGDHPFAGADQVPELVEIDAVRVRVPRGPRRVVRPVAALEQLFHRPHGDLQLAFGFLRYHSVLYVARYEVGRHHADLGREIGHNVERFHEERQGVEGAHAEMFRLRVQPCQYVPGGSGVIRRAENGLGVGVQPVRHLGYDDFPRVIVHGPCPVLVRDHRGYYLHGPVKLFHGLVGELHHCRRGLCGHGARDLQIQLPRVLLELRYRVVYVEYLRVDLGVDEEHREFPYGLDKVLQVPEFLHGRGEGQSLLAVISAVGPGELREPYYEREAFPGFQVGDPRIAHAFVLEQLDGHLERLLRDGLLRPGFQLLFRNLQVHRGRPDRSVQVQDLVGRYDAVTRRQRVPHGFEVRLQLVQDLLHLAVHLGHRGAVIAFIKRSVAVGVLVYVEPAVVVHVADVVRDPDIGIVASEGRVPGRRHRFLVGGIQLAVAVGVLRPEGVRQRAVINDVPVKLFKARKLGFSHGSLYAVCKGTVRVFDLEAVDAVDQRNRLADDHIKVVVLHGQHFLDKLVDVDVYRLLEGRRLALRRRAGQDHALQGAEPAVPRRIEFGLPEGRPYYKVALRGELRLTGTEGPERRRFRFIKLRRGVRKVHPGEFRVIEQELYITGQFLFFGLQGAHFIHGRGEGPFSGFIFVPGLEDEHLLLLVLPVVLLLGLQQLSRLRLQLGLGRGDLHHGVAQLLRHPAVKPAGHHALREHRLHVLHGELFAQVPYGIAQFLADVSGHPVLYVVQLAPVMVHFLLLGRDLYGKFGVFHAPVALVLFELPGSLVVSRQPVGVYLALFPLGPDIFEYKAHIPVHGPSGAEHVRGPQRLFRQLGEVFQAGHYSRRIAEAVAGGHALGEGVHNLRVGFLFIDELFNLGVDRRARDVDHQFLQFLLAVDACQGIYLGQAVGFELGGRIERLLG